MDFTTHLEIWSWTKQAILIHSLLCKTALFLWMGCVVILRAGASITVWKANSTETSVSFGSKTNSHHYHDNLKINHVSHRLKTGRSISCPVYGAVLGFFASPPCLSYCFSSVFQCGDVVEKWAESNVGLCPSSPDLRCAARGFSVHPDRILLGRFESQHCASWWFRREFPRCFLPSWVTGCCYSVCQLTNKLLLSCYRLHRKHQTVLWEADLAGGCFLSLACSSVELGAEFPLEGSDASLLGRLPVYACVWRVSCSRVCYKPHLPL